jgi:glycosyltransferase involved in cell wall biosynthesis
MGHRLGYEVNIYAQNFEANSDNVSPMEHLFRDVDESDILLVAYSIYDPYLDALLKLNCKKICYFHGVTTPRLLDEFEIATAKLCRLAIEQIKEFKNFDTVVCNSRYTSLTLKNIMNPMQLLVIPPVFSDMPAYKKEATRSSRKDELNFLMVGRCVPHKNIELAIEVLAEVNNYFKNATLSIVGSTPNYNYLKFLINKARKLGVLSSIDFTGAIHDKGLANLYSSTSGLLVTSRHEGFCVPVLEAMSYGRPIFVLGGNAAQELCLKSEIFSDIDSPSTWATRISAVVKQSESEREEEACEKMACVLTVLNLASDSIWLSALGDGEGV